MTQGIIIKLHKSPKKQAVYNAKLQKIVNGNQDAEMRGKLLTHRAAINEAG